MAYVTPVPGRRTVTSDSVQHLIEMLARRHVEMVVTSAITPPEEIAFAAAGFSLRERLHLLRHDLQSLDQAAPRLPGRIRLRRARSSDRSAILATDDAAFDSFWRFDEAGLGEAIDATPSSRVRVAADHEVFGYAVSGRAGRVGYLQRLAVHPSRTGNGIGATLVVDGLRWMRRRGAHHALVNTQVVNERAYQLYLRLGFVPEPHGLAVLECSLVPS